MVGEHGAVRCDAMFGHRVHLRAVDAALADGRLCDGAAPRARREIQLSRHTAVDLSSAGPSLRHGVSSQRGCTAHGLTVPPHQQAARWAFDMARRTAEKELRQEMCDGGL